MADLADAFDQLMSFDMWEEVAAILAGFFAPTVLNNLVSGFVPAAADIPETYGLAVVGAAQFAPSYSNELSLGGGLYTADKLAERTGIKQTVVSVGA